MSDEFYWAACELYITTGDDKYLEDAAESAFFLKVVNDLSGGESVDTFGAFDWGHTASLGTISLIITDNDLSEKDRQTAVKNLQTAADVMVRMEAGQGYGIPYGSSTLSSTDSSVGYQWGSNSFILDNSMILAYAYLETGDIGYMNAAISAMDYILGKNANDYSYVTGYGSHYAMYPHHRFWARLIDDSFPAAPAGVLVGGPNSGMQDPWVRGMGWKKGTIPPAKCYLDHIEAYSVNECAINWNAPLAWMTAFIAGNTEGISVGSFGITSGIGALGSAPAPEDMPETTENAQGADSAPVQGNTAVPTAPSGETAQPSVEVSREEVAGVVKIAIIVFGVIAVVIPTEIFIYKIMRLKKGDDKEKEKKE